MRKIEQVQADRRDWLNLDRASGQGRRTPGRAAGRRDALTGAALVCLLPLVVISTSWVLPPNDGTVAWTLAIGVGASLLALSLLWLPWHRLPASLLLVFPAILAATLIATANLERTITASYVGFVTVSFIYIGMTQSRLMPVLAMPIAVPIYLLCEVHVTPAIGVRLPIAVVIWLLIGEVLADRSVRSRRQTALLAAQVNRDDLTGLMSRTGLFQEVSQALSDFDESDGGCFLFLLDIDGFKSVNDTYGHPVGDEILIAFSQRIRDTVRSVDVAARLGGDEFAVLIRGGNVEVATSLGTRLLAAAARPFDLSFGRVIVTASEGIVELTEAMTAPDAIHDVDVAMYEAKSNGRNRLAFFEPRLQQQIANRARVRTEIYTGIEKGEFDLHWQPTVHIGTGRTVGVEALIRWHHPVVRSAAPRRVHQHCRRHWIDCAAGEMGTRTGMSAR
jgi:diguanylate cyclase (GGDEF)-like protein